MAEDHYDAGFFETFRSRNIVEVAVDFARVRGGNRDGHVESAEATEYLHTKILVFETGQLNLMYIHPIVNNTT